MVISIIIIFYPFLNSQTHEIKIKEEGYFRNFDLVIALINKESKQNKN